MTLAALMTTAPAVGAGVPVDGTWRLVVDAVLPATAASVVGNAKVGTNIVSGDVWVDLTQWVTGVDVTRGAAGTWGSHTPPASGVIGLDNTGHAWSAWRNIGDGWGHRITWGLPIRVGLRSSVAWRPIFTGIVDDPLELIDNHAAAPTVDLTVTGTLAAAADLNLLDHVINAEHATYAATVTALLDQIAWPYGAVIDVPQLTGTDQETFGGVRYSGPVLDTVRRLADAAAVHVTELRDGRLGVVRRRPDLVWTTTDPNKPAAVTINTASTDPNTLRIRPAGSAAVNDITIEGVHEPGIFGPATVTTGPSDAPRRVALGDASLRFGLAGPAVHDTPDDVDKPFPGRYNLVVARNHLGWSRRPTSRRVADMPHNSIGYPVHQIAAANLVALYGDPDQLWTISGLGVDQAAAVTYAVTPIDIGSPATVTHSLAGDTATFTGHVAELRWRINPLNPAGPTISLDIAVDAHQITRT